MQPSKPLAGLPMYDWPEIRAATDRLWQALREEFLQAGFAAPAELERSLDRMALWRHPDLLLAQSCGFPYATLLGGAVGLIGTPAYAIGCAPGRYCSVVVARREDAAAPIERLVSGRFAFNSRDSQSGYRAPLRMIAAGGLPAPEKAIEARSHRSAIRIVAEGRADFAAIDAVSWELALRHEPAAGKVAVVTRTPETPALPYITAKANAGLAATLADAVSRAIAGLDTGTRNALLLEGFVRMRPQDYTALAEPIPAAAPGLPPL
ncbi:MAG: phosphate/phosphite/phosphonate ABC transporter substrate-binding protein [Pararhizobium sp.]